MTIGMKIVRAIAAFANLHPIAQAALIDWYEAEGPGVDACRAGAD